MKTEETVTGIDTKAGIEAKDDLSGLKSSLETLFHAFAHGSGSVTDQAVEVIGAVREVGIDNLVRLTREGSEEATQLLGAVYIAMQQADEKGVPEAGEVASTIARKLEEAGYTIQHECGQGCSCKH